MFHSQLQRVSGLGLFVMACALQVFMTTTALAQGDYAQLSGVVRDNTGAVIPNATIKIASEALGVSRTATSNAEGVYQITQLRPSAYKLTVEAASFKTSVLPDIQPGVGQSRGHDVTLEAGQVTEVINVTAGDEPASVDTASARLGANVTAREVAELPVNGRNVSQLYILSPGATNVGSGNFNEIRFNGRSNQQNQVKLDGVESTAIWDASPGYRPCRGHSSACRLHWKTFRNSASIHQTIRRNTAPGLVDRSRSLANAVKMLFTAAGFTFCATTNSTRRTISMPRVKNRSCV
ncbi:MAG: carboxypeptidase-like regulatory domain-containing protein [Blastocatellia bacterium]